MIIDFHVNFRRRGGARVYRKTTRLTVPKDTFPHMEKTGMLSNFKKCYQGRKKISESSLLRENKGMRYVHFCNLAQYQSLFLRALVFSRMLIFFRFTHDPRRDKAGWCPVFSLRTQCWISTNSVPVPWCCQFTTTWSYHGQLSYMIFNTMWNSIKIFIDSFVS